MVGWLVRFRIFKSRQLFRVTLARIRHSKLFYFRSKHTIKLCVCLICLKCLICLSNLLLKLFIFLNRSIPRCIIIICWYTYYTQSPPEHCFKSLVTMSRVTYFIPWAHMGNCQTQYKGKQTIREK